MRRKAILAAPALLFAAATTFAADALRDPREGEFLLGPLPFQQTVGGVPLDLRVSAFLRIQEENENVRLGVRLVMDLADLQMKIGPLFDTLPLPTDNCHHFGVDNDVAQIWRKQLQIAGSTATIQLNGDVDVWTCAKNIPCSRVEWDGIVPRVISYDCNPPIKNRNLRQPFTARLPFQLTTDGQSLAIRVGEPSVDLGGPLGGVTGTILQIVGVSVNAKAEELVNGAINAESLRLSLPAEIRQFDLRIADAQLLDNNGALAAMVELRASVPADKVQELLALQVPLP